MRHIQSLYDLGLQLARPSGIAYRRGLDVVARSKPKPDVKEFRSIARCARKPDFGDVAALNELNVPSVGDDPVSVNPDVIASNGLADIACEEIFEHYPASDDQRTAVLHSRPSSGRRFS